MKLALTITGSALAIALGAFLAFTGHVHAAQPRCGAGLGLASWYGTESGSRTATGAYFDGRGMTAAMPSRSMLRHRARVTLFVHGNAVRSIIVEVNDIGPAARLHRVIDLSSRAAEALGIKAAGTGCVTVADLGK